MHKTGDVLSGKYRLVRSIGRGGMGEVFEAEHLELQKRFAIKIPTAELMEDVVNLERFKREPKVAAATGHRCIVDVYDIGITRVGIPFVVMEYLEGESFGDLIQRETRINITLASYVIAQVLSALSAAHAKGIIHRDLKPDNVMLVQTGQPIPEVKLLDFGTSKVLEGGGKVVQSLTQSGTILGTPYYMAPEQIRASRTLDGRLDVYAAGVMLYEAVTGHVPFYSDNVYSLVHMVLHDELVHPRVLRSDIPPELEQVILKAMERNRDKRYASAEEMLRELLPFLDEMTQMQIWVPSSLRKDLLDSVESSRSPVATLPTPLAGRPLAWTPASLVSPIFGSDKDSSLILGKYVPLRKLASGRTGTIFLGRTEGESSYRKPVAIKVIHPHLTEKKARIRAFIQETKLATRLHHPNLIQVLDFGEHQGRYIIILEYAHSYKLNIITRYLSSIGRPLNVEHSAYVISKVLEGLDYAHSLSDDLGSPLGLIHNSISPDHIHITVDGQIKLTDFDVGQLLTDRGTERSGVNFAYSSPEQVNDEPLDHRVDIFAVGIVLYELLCNQPLFGASGAGMTIMRVSKADVPDICTVRPDLPRNASYILKRALARDPIDRYLDAGAFASDLRLLMGGATAADVEPTFRAMMTQTLLDEGFKSSAGALFDLSQVLTSTPIDLGTLSTAIDSAEIEKLKTTTTPPPRKRSSIRLFVGILSIIMLLAGSSVGAYLALNQSRRTPDSPRGSVALIINQQGPDAASAHSINAPEDSPDETAGDAALVATNSDGGGEAAASPTRPSDRHRSNRSLRPLTGRIVTNRLMRQQSRLLRCFRRNHGAITAIRVVINGNGSVASASVEPTNVNSTPLGRCVTKIAHSTRFPRHPEESTAFRIPARLSSEP